jgi:hypothetical protein
MLNTEETRAGAMACMEALLAMQSNAEKSNAETGSNGWVGWWKNEDGAVAAMLHAAGNPSGFQAGFIAVLAEYIHAEQIVCNFNLDTWRKPEATMTDEEKLIHRAEFEKPE